MQSVHKRTTHRTRLPRELHHIFVRLKRICNLVYTCLTLCCSLTCRLPRAHHLPHSLFLLPRHQNTQHNRDNTIISKNTQYNHELLQPLPVDKQRHQESLWRKNLQSGGNPRKTTPTGYQESLWRENLQSGGNPRKTTPTGYEPKELATVSIFLMHRIDLENMITQLQSHFGSRTISAQVNIVAVSDHVFHRFPFDLLIQVSATKLSLFLCIPSFRWLPIARLKMQCTLPCLVHRRRYLQLLVLLTVLLLTLDNTVSRPITMEEKSTRSTYSYRSSCKTRPELKITSRHFLKQWPPRRLRLQVLNKLLGASWLALPLWKQVQALALASPTRQDLGTYSDKVTAPQPLDLSRVPWPRVIWR